MVSVAPRTTEQCDVLYSGVVLTMGQMCSNSIGCRSLLTWTLCKKNITREQRFFFLAWKTVPFWIVFFFHFCPSVVNLICTKIKVHSGSFLYFIQTLWYQRMIWFDFTDVCDQVIHMVWIQRRERNHYGSTWWYCVYIKLTYVSGLSASLPSPLSLQG